MRIGIDMIGVQDPGGRGRGIGRYSELFVNSLVTADPCRRYILYFYNRLGCAQWNAPANVEIRVVAAGRHPLAKVAQELVNQNRDALDLFLITSPMTATEGYRPPFRQAGGVCLVAILYDLIPMLHDRERYLADLSASRHYYESVRRLRQYDRLLTISEASRQDCLTYLGLPAEQLVNISAAPREEFFAPALSAELPQGLRALGIRKPFVLSVAGTDPRKNSAGLVRAFAQLPAGVRATHQLVLVCASSPTWRQELQWLAAGQGVADQLVLTGHIGDDRLREAYQHCAAFALLSHYEGFGLPLVEAMLCGAPVVGGSNSSQPEVVGNAGLLAHTRDDAHVAAQLSHLLTDSNLATALRRRGPQQARQFTWQATVGRTLETFAALGPHGVRKARPLLALFSPLPPQRTGVADYAAALLGELRRHYTIHLYHDRGQIPHVALADSELAAFDYRLFERHHRVWNYHAVLYQLGNAPCHRFVYETLRRQPGIVTLHDLRLDGFQAWYDHYLGRRPLVQALGVVVHDAEGAERLRQAHPACSDRIVVIPVGQRAAACHDWSAVASQYVAVIEKAAASSNKFFQVSA